MNDQQLKRSLQSIGMGCFAKHFALFSDRSISNSAAVDALMVVEKYTESGSRTRVSQSRRIIREGLAMAALRIISQSERVDPEWRRKAEDLSNVKL